MVLMGDHDWFSIIAVECAIWLTIYWRNTGQWSLIREAINGSRSLNTPGPS
jgi:hypothetical protein